MHYTRFPLNNPAGIAELFRSTFTDSEGADEGNLIGNLAFDLLTSTAPDELALFVALDDDRLTAAIIFSRMGFEQDISGYLMAPVAVLTEHQGKGIGQALIEYALQELMTQGVELVITYGDPNFYSKSGFKPISEQVIRAPLPLTYPHGWLARSLVSKGITTIPGTTRCVAAISKPEFW